MKIYTNKNGAIKSEMFDEALALTKNQVENLAVGVEFVSAFKIKALNKRIRGINKVTDVLSFPMLEGEKFEFLQACEEERDPFSGELYLGDIVICSCRAKKQAKDFGHSLERELSFLALHGFLHLLGFDHMNPEEEKEMQSLAEKVLAKFGLTRGKDV